MADYVDEVLASWQSVRPDLDTGPLAVAMRLQRAAQAMQTRLDALADASGPISHKGDLDTLTALRRAGPGSDLTPSELAQAGQLTSGGMTNRLDRLEANQLIRRSPDPNDRRGVLVRLTPRGAAVADAGFEQALEAQRTLLEPLSNTDQQRLARALSRLLVAMGDAPIGLGPVATD